MKEEEKTIKAYKGFEKDLSCRGFKYEVGKEYENTEEISVCNNGFHACQNPLDVLNYYGDVLDNRFCEVEQSGIVKTEGDKTASSKIKVKAEVSFVGLFKAGIEWLKEITNPVNVNSNVDGLSDKGRSSAKIGSSGYYARIGSSGYSAKIGSSGAYAQIGSSGYYAQIGSSGYYAQIGSSGNSAKIGSSGYSAKIGSSGAYAQIGSSGAYAQIGSSGAYAKIGSSGAYAQIGSSGNSAKIGSSGDYAQIGSSGDYAQIGSSGDYAKIGSSGDYAKIGSSGYSAKIGSSGDYAQIGSSGAYAKIGSSGAYAQIGSSGEDSVICCTGNGSVVKAKVGSWITLSEWVYNDDKCRWVPKCVKTEYVDGERIKGDTWYRLIDGEFTEVNSSDDERH